MTTSRESKNQPRKTRSRERRALKRKIFTKSYEIFNAVWKAEGVPSSAIKTVGTEPACIEELIGDVQPM